MNDLVSVVVPIYNVKLYLRDCLESIINQTYRNLEIILSDDGSTDGCNEICDEYALKDKRITVIHEENGGSATARNRAIDLAKGKYITYIDSDDCIHLRYVEILLNIAEQAQADVVVGGYKVFAEKSLVVDKDIKEEDVKKAERLQQSHLYDEEFIKKETTCLTTPWGTLYRLELFDGIRYPDGKIHEDTFTTWRVMERANKVVYLREPLYYWRENPNSITRGKFKIEHLLELDAYREQLEHFSANGKQRYVEIVFDEYLDCFFWCYNRMRETGMLLSSLSPYCSYIRKNVKHIKMSRSLGIKQWLRYRYLAYYKIPKIIGGEQN